MRYISELSSSETQRRSSYPAYNVVDTQERSSTEGRLELASTQGRVLAHNIRKPDADRIADALNKAA